MPLTIGATSASVALPNTCGSAPLPWHLSGAFLSGLATICTGSGMALLFDCVGADVVVVRLVRIVMILSSSGVCSRNDFNSRAASTSWLAQSSFILSSVRYCLSSRFLAGSWGSNSLLPSAVDR